MRTPEHLLRLIKEGKYIKFYKSKEWKELRKEILERDANECVHCRKKGWFRPAECIHHIKHLKARPDLALEPTNLVTLCNQCHNKEHPEKLKAFHTKEFPKEFKERW